MQRKHKTVRGELTVSEIAAISGMAVGTVRRRLELGMGDKPELFSPLSLRSRGCRRTGKATKNREWGI